MSWLKFVNVFFCQWFFIRLAKCQEKRVVTFNVQSYDLTPDGISSRGTGEVKVFQWYSLMFWVVPTTGWGNDYKYIGKKSPRYLKLTKEKSL
jgi:hypothetical protein